MLTDTFLFDRDTVTPVPMPLGPGAFAVGVTNHQNAIGVGVTNDHNELGVGVTNDHMGIDDFLF